MFEMWYEGCRMFAEMSDVDLQLLMVIVCWPILTTLMPELAFHHTFQLFFFYFQCLPK